MIEVQLPGQLLILTPGEVTSLLAMKPGLWEKALRDLQTAGFISGYVSGQGVSQVEAFKRWVFR